MDRKNRRHPRDNRSQDHHSMAKIDRILIDIQRELRESVRPVTLDNLTAFERKRIHTFFDDKPEFKTKTYRNDNHYVLKVFPIGNLKQLAEEKLKQVIETGKSVQLKNLGNFERFVIHDYLKSEEGIETISIGEGRDRVLEIKQKQFGRTLKRIIRKIKLF